MAGGSLTGVSTRGLLTPQPGPVSLKFCSIKHATLNNLSHLYIRFFFFHFKILIIIKKKVWTPTYVKYHSNCQEIS